MKSIRAIPYERARKQIGRGNVVALVTYVDSAGVEQTRAHRLEKLLFDRDAILLVTGEGYIRLDQVRRIRRWREPNDAAPDKLPSETYLG